MCQYNKRIAGALSVETINKFSPLSLERGFLATIKMERPFFLSGLFVLLILPVANFELCNEVDRTFDVERMYFVLEEALIGDEVLELLRVIFLRSEVSSVHFNVKLDMISPTLEMISTDDDDKTFCSSDQYHWTLCSNCRLDDIVFSTKGVSKYLADVKELQTVRLITLYLTLLHGNLMSFSVLLLPSAYKFEYDTVYEVYTKLNLSLDYNSDTFNPSCIVTKCALTELLTWVSEIIQ